MSSQEEKELRDGELSPLWLMIDSPRTMEDVSERRSRSMRTGKKHGPWSGSTMRNSSGMNITWGKTDCFTDVRSCRI